MNRKTLFLFCLTGIMLFKCSEIDELLTFRISHQTSMTIQSASPLNLPVSVPTPAITTNSSQQFQNNNTRADLVKDVRLEDLSLTITSPSSKTFSFLRSINIYISTDQNDEIKVAYLDNIVTSASMIMLTPVNVKLDKYVKSDTYKLRTEIVTKETLAQDVEVKVDLRFKVTARAL